MLRNKKITLLSSILVISLLCSAEADTTVVINELMASNNNSGQDPQGQYEDWIEIHNYGTADIDIGGMYLTDNLSDPDKWRIPDNNPALTTIPAGGYLLIWADNDIDDEGLHANFKLDADGEQVGLVDIDGANSIDSVTFSGQTTDISYGRYPDAGQDWRFFPTASPGSENTGAYLGEVADTKFSHNRGFYDESFYVTITTETEDAVIYYSLDGSVPGEYRGRAPRRTLYTAPVLIERTTCLRAKAYKDGWKSSNADTQTYIFLDDVIEQPRYPPGFPTSWGSNRVDYEMDPDIVNDPAYASTIKEDLQTIPSVCIVIGNGDFFGSHLGIYANASQRGINWEREASIEWIDPISETDFQVNAGLRIHGGAGRSSSVAKHSLRILFKNEYGPSQLKFPLFEDTDMESFDSLVLRASWNYSYFGDSTYCEGIGTEHTQYLRDQFARDTARDMGALTPYGRHVHLYINGLYWGLYILAERPDDGFASNHLGGEKENYEVLKASNGTPLDIVAGDRNAWNTLFGLAARDLSSIEAYEEIQQYLDVPAMIDYLLMIYYVGSRDAPVLLCNDNNPRNFYTLRRREPAGPFIFVPWDVEWSLEWPDWWRANRVEIVGRENPHYLLNRLNSNSEFRMLLADHIHRHFFNDGALTPANSINRYLFRANEIDRAIVGESARWGDSRRSRPYTRNLEWVAERDRMVYEYFSIRTDIVLDQLRQAGFYPAVSAPEFYVNGQSQHGGYVNLDDTISMDTAEGTIWYTLDGTDPRLPETTIQPSNQLTLVSENTSKRILVPTGQISEDWKTSVNYRDSSWLEGRGGVGYDTGQDYRQLFDIDLYDQMYQNQTSCFIQIPFNVTQDTSQFNIMTLRILYDDGFVAYINGVEVARRNFTGTPAWNSNADTIHDDSAAVNFEDINISLHLDVLHPGDNILAIHGLNQSTTSSDFLISPELVITQSNSTSPNSISATAIQYNEAFQLTHSTNIKARTLSGSTWSALNEATFAVGPISDNLRITEIMYHPQSLAGLDGPNEEFIELTNIGAEIIKIRKK